MITQPESYPARLDIDYPAKLDQFTTFFRLIWAIPIVIILTVLSSTASSTVIVVTKTGETVSEVTRTSGGIAAGLWLETVLMIVFRERYPRWWFDFARELTRFEARVGAYIGLLTDRYLSTVDKQAVHLEIDYPDVDQDLNRWLPLVKWFLAVPHFIVLAVLAVVAFFAIIVAWFAVLFTGRYPRALFHYVVGVTRWGLRVVAYAVLLITDRYPPFNLK